MSFRTTSRPHPRPHTLNTNADMNSGWSGYTPSVLKQHPTAGLGVEAFYVDEQEELIISATRKELIVSELNAPGDVLWSIKMDNYFRFIYGNGYLMLERKRPAGTYEVWRRRCDDTESDSGTLNEARKPSTADVIDVPGVVAYFVPWTVITTEHKFTCINGSLATEVCLSEDDEETTVHLWDLHSGIRMTSYERLYHSHPHFTGPITRAHVENMALTDDFIFVTKENSFQAFSRHDKRCIVDWSARQDVGARWMYKVGKEEDSGVDKSSLLRPCQVPVTYSPNEKKRSDWDAFVQTRVSPCGTVIYLIKSSRIYVIFDFDRIASGAASLEENTLEIRVADGKLFCFDSCLSLEGRLALVSALGVFVIELEWSECPKPTSKAAARTPRRADGLYLRNVHVSRAICYSDSEALIRQTKVVLTNSVLYSTWFPEASTKYASIKMNRAKEDYLTGELYNGLIYPNYPKAKGNTATIYSVHVDASEAQPRHSVQAACAPPDSVGHWKSSLLKRFSIMSRNVSTRV